ncbi:nucleoside deaminase [bacterium]|nr:nucleoside deaminase [bacterium]
MFSNQKIISNEKIDKNKIKNATTIIKNLQNELLSCIEVGCGPFLAAIFDENGNLIAKETNSVVNQNCSNNHAEMNVIKKAQEIYNTYDLSSYNLSLYVTAEPCIMCIGGIMWSGIKNVFYGVSSKKVEKITGFDEGFKPSWLKEFKKRGIVVYGNIETKLGESVLEIYLKNNGKIYKPNR